jgi:hypothetical protein
MYHSMIETKDVHACLGRRGRGGDLRIINPWTSLFKLKMFFHFENPHVKASLKRAHFDLWM